MDRDLSGGWRYPPFEQLEPGGKVTKDGGPCSHKDLWVFFIVQDGGFILSTLIQMNTSTHLPVFFWEVRILFSMTA